MRKKIIFIDIDGPLSWGSWNDGSVSITPNETWDNGRLLINEGMVKPFTIPYPWDIPECEALQTILDETNAQLVLSSDWRNHFSFKQMGAIFQHYGIHRSHLIDTTTYQYLWDKMSRPSGDYMRAAQIAKWVKDNKISNWIAIDDLNVALHFKFMNIPQWRHVKVNGEMQFKGKLRNKIDECITKLNR